MLEPLCELHQDRPTHYWRQQGTVRRLDRGYTTMVSWALRLVNISVTLSDEISGKKPLTLLSKGPNQSS